MNNEVQFPSRKQQSIENVLIFLTIVMILIGITFIYVGLKNTGPYQKDDVGDPVKYEILKKIGEIEKKIDEIKDVVGGG